MTPQVFPPRFPSLTVTHFVLEATVLSPRMHERTLIPIYVEWLAQLLRPRLVCSSLECTALASFSSITLPQSVVSSANMDNFDTTPSYTSFMQIATAVVPLGLLILEALRP